MLALWIISGVVGYLLMGIVVSLIYIKMSGTSFNDIDKEQYIAFPIFLWPIIIIIEIIICIVKCCSVLYKLVAVYIFRIPLDNVSSEDTKNDPEPVIRRNNVRAERVKSSPKTPKPDVIPPSQVSRFDLMDME